MRYQAQQPTHVSISTGTQVIVQEVRTRDGGDSVIRALLKFRPDLASAPGFDAELIRDGEVVARYDKEARAFRDPQATLAATLNDVIAERARQDAKWGADRRLGRGAWHLILSEEVGEVAKAALERDPGLRDELIQVAAVAIAWAEAIDRATT